MSTSLTILSAMPVAHWMGPHPGPFLFLIPLVFLLLVGALVFALVFRRRRFAPQTGPWAAPSRGSSAEQILAERFARGEVDEPEYRARLEALRAHRPDA
ncbi:SHOCT domain-containing protein [Microbacterium sp. SORGH_AS_0888]|uniref:SHOCT domain-containing protein n=1 Tax=Microbacterium sp. SORGH_AS_0888 TaxID=3041791 RepID=UPI00278AE026|nr:hypothetical protein [Microbacterium sp. SORGH_AS_0888]MDQ1128680.1 putative membrane protein [Microbacterium sp. SORGH_AS_0888]